MHVIRLALIIFSLSAVGCGGSDTQHSSGHTELGTPPAELTGARLLYESDGGIYVKTVGSRDAEKVVDQGRWPRWSSDGKAFAYVHDNQVMLYDVAKKKAQRLAAAAKGRAVTYHPNGREVLFTDGKTVRSVDIATKTVRDLLDGPRVMELDISPDARYLAVTEKSFGYHVNIYDLTSGEKVREIKKGCSASLSPDGSRVTVNLDGHVELGLFDRGTGEKAGSVNAPEGLTLDNQFWSNHPDWIVAMTEGNQANIVAQRVSDDAVFQLTRDGSGDRPDLFIP